MSADANSVIYYTTDGSDPRLVGGLVSPPAILCQGPISVQAGIPIAARDFESGFNVEISDFGQDKRADKFISPEERSGLRTADVVDMSANPIEALRITEVHYNPLGDDAVEFVELQNTSNVGTIDLSGVRFTQGFPAIFDFPAAMLRRWDRENSF